MKVCADVAALLLRVYDTIQSASRNWSVASTWMRFRAIGAFEGAHDALRLLAAEEAVVDEDAGELVADGAVDESGRDGGVDAAGEGADDAAVAHLLPYARHAFLDEVARRPEPAAVADVVQEVLDELRA